MSQLVQKRFVSAHDGPLLRLILAADAANQALFTQARLRPAVAELERLCDCTGHSIVHGLSDAGQRLAGALMFARPGIESWRPGVERVLLLDGVVAGLDGIAIAAPRLRSMGAMTIDACVVELIANDPPPLEIEELYILGSDNVTEPAARAA
jgi:hypothetical protein